MGLSASQARFLQLTARKSNVEYQAQRINFERLQLSDKSAAAAQRYNDLTSNRKLTYTFNSGDGKTTVDLTYNNYKNYMNVKEGTAQKPFYLVSTSGKKIIVSNEDEISKMMEDNKDNEGNSLFSYDDFMIAPDLDNVENFQKAIQDGIYYFATLDENEETGKKEFNTIGWDTLGSGAISEEYDKTDDAAAQAEYDSIQSKIQSTDKKLELQLDKLNTEREAIQTELESVKKVIDDNIESSFKAFS